MQQNTTLKSLEKNAKQRAQTAYNCKNNNKCGITGQKGEITTRRAKLQPDGRNHNQKVESTTEMVEITTRWAKLQLGSRESVPNTLKTSFFLHEASIPEG